MNGYGGCTILIKCPPFSKLFRYLDMIRCSDKDQTQYVATLWIYSVFSYGSSSVFGLELHVVFFVEITLFLDRPPAIVIKSDTIVWYVCTIHLTKGVWVIVKEV